MSQERIIEVPKKILVSGNGHSDGTPLADPRHGERAKSAIQKVVEGNQKNAISKHLAWLYKWDPILDEELINPILTDKSPLPRPVYGVEDLGARTYGAYHLGLNSVGLEDQITLNIRYLPPYRDEYGVLETVAHEKCHLKQQHQGEHPYKGGSDQHNREFIEMARKIGLDPMPVKGFHIKPAGNPFELVVARYGVLKPDYKPVEGEKRNYWTVDKPSGRSTLEPWECPDCGFKVRVGKKVEESPVACIPCSVKKRELVAFVRSGT